ncbi:MAG TPA: hypothetical protein VFD49_16965 [Candidatus Dormibacteraeota bacterium]|nr:hypothetical protein [Candidatus Dormibacteraeota bacterium]
MRTSRQLVEAVANAVLYEGYLLYPYRRSAVKNQVRWTFGLVHPRGWSEATGGTEPWDLEAGCLLRTEACCRLQVSVRFLHLLQRSGPEGSWQEASERTVEARDLELRELLQRPVELPIRAPAAVHEQDGVRREWRALEGVVEVEARPLPVADGVGLRVRVANTTVLEDAGTLRRDQVLPFTLASAHAVLWVESGAFLSAADPPPELRAAADALPRRGWWPVLVGEPGTGDCLLLSPIILEDHPRVAEESPGDLFDATEIDELLTLRILTLSEAEKEELRRGDERARRLLERTESLTPTELMRLHGAVRELRIRRGWER